MIMALPVVSKLKTPDRTPVDCSVSTEKIDRHLVTQQFGQPIRISQELLDERGITLDDLLDAYFTGKRL